MIKLIIRASFCFQLIGPLNILTLKQAARGLGLVVEVLKMLLELKGSQVQKLYCSGTGLSDSFAY